MAELVQTTGPLKGGVANLTNAGKGRPKGVPNKMTTLAKAAIAEAFDRMGGTEALVRWADKDDDTRKSFYTTIYPKLLPLQMEHSGVVGLRQRLLDDDAD